MLVLLSISVIASFTSAISSCSSSGESVNSFSLGVGIGLAFLSISVIASFISVKLSFLVSVGSLDVILCVGSW